jgi:transposase-like protein
VSSAPGKHRRYTARQKASAVTMALISNASAAAEQTGIPERNIRRWQDDPEMAEYAAKTREEIAEEARALGVKVLAEIKDRLKEFDPKDLSILWGILTDKSQLLAGQATSRTETRDITATLDDHEQAALRHAIDEWLSQREPV